jgi:hypothetical protein
MTNPTTVGTGIEATMAISPNPVPNSLKSGTGGGDALKKLRFFLQQCVVILSVNLLSSTHGIANTGHGHFRLAGQFRE